ncbi:MAG: fasciclin domain-containing protein [Phycisphaerales bacterium]|nr:fasciclin domain-containing protein [Phycisphaerales bacterium]
MKRAIAAFAVLSVAGVAAGQCESTKSAQACTAGEAYEGAAVLASYVQPEMNLVETAVNAGSFDTLVAAVKAAGLVDALSGDKPMTVFAPTDEAFAKLPEGTVEMLLKPENKELLKSILLYHVVPGDVRAEQVIELKAAQTANGQRVDIKVSGGKVRVDDANVVKTDILTSNGTIHVIDRVIMPTSKNILEIAEENGSFGTLVAAIKAAGIVDGLMDAGDITVFAPTDEAFAKLPKGTVEMLLKPENKEKLAEILRYHVVKGRVYSDQAVEAGWAKTLQGGKVQIELDHGKAMINNAQILTTDIDASNGVIHVIDTVIMPEK